MAARASLLADVYDALVDGFTAGLSVPVLDGPLLQSPSVEAWVMVGATELPPDIDGELAQSNSNRSAMGNGEFRDDQGFVTFSAWSWSGDPAAVRTCRRTATDLLDQCEAVVAADPSLGGVLKFGFFADVGSSALTQWQTDKGCTVRATSTVTYQTLLTP